MNKSVEMNRRLYFLFVFSLIVISLTINTTLAQGKFSLGMDAGLRFEKPRIDDAQNYLIRNLFPSGTIGIIVAKDYSDKIYFESGIYRTTFITGVSAFYNQPGYMRFSRYGEHGSGGFSTIQIPVRMGYNLLEYKRFKFNLLGGIHLFYQFDNREWTSSIGSGTSVFPQPAPFIWMDFESRIKNRLSLSAELGSELVYVLSERINVSYRFSGMLGVRRMVSIEGTYSADNRPHIKHSFKVDQYGTGINHFVSMRFRLGKS